MLKRNWERAISIIKKDLEDLIKTDKFYYKTISEIAKYLETHKRNEKEPDKDIIETAGACAMMIKTIIEALESIERPLSERQERDLSKRQEGD